MSTVPSLTGENAILREAIIRLRDQRTDSLRAAKQLVSEVIVGYENEQQEGWAQDFKFHQCEVCYNSAKRLRQVILQIDVLAEQNKPDNWLQHHLHHTPSPDCHLCRERL